MKMEMFPQNLQNNIRMKTIKNLTATVQYEVSLENLEVSDEIYEQLLLGIDDIDDEETLDWLVENIEEIDEPSLWEITKLEIN